MSEGIDIYTSNQTVNNWASVQHAGIDWCYQKVSDGVTTRSPQSVAAGKAAGVRQGGYHFSQPGSPQGQAGLLLSQCNKYGLLDLNLCLDLEDNPASLNKPNIPNSEKAAWAIAFGRAVLASGNGFTLYASDSVWKTILYNPVMNALPGTFRWVARYGGNPTVIYDAHQYTSTGSVAGISAGGVDRSRGLIPINDGGDMALTTEELAILKAAADDADYSAKVLGRYPDSTYGGSAGNWDAAENIRRIIRDHPTKTDLNSVSNTLTASISSLQDKIDNLTIGGVDLDTLAAKVADLLAARLKD